MIFNSYYVMMRNDWRNSFVKQNAGQNNLKSKQLVKFWALQAVCNLLRKIKICTRCLH